MEYKESQIPLERWLNNLVEAADAIADKERQEARWLAPDAYAWERPEELINDLFDSYNFELFVQKYSGTFSSDQLRSAVDLRDHERFL